jgi:hypothetical protein
MIVTQDDEILILDVERRSYSAPDSVCINGVFAAEVTGCTGQTKSEWDTDVG